MESYDPPDPWGWCYVDEEMLDFSGQPDAASARKPPAHSRSAQIAMSKAPDKPLAIDPGHPDDGHDVLVAAGAIGALLPPNLASRRRSDVSASSQPAEIDRLRRFGTVKTWQPGEFLFEAGKPGPGMFVLLRGRVADHAQERVGRRGAHRRACAGPIHGRSRPALRPSLACRRTRARRRRSAGDRSAVAARGGDRRGRARRAHHARADPAARGIDRNRRRRPGADRRARHPRTWCGCRDSCRATAIRIPVLDPALESRRGRGDEAACAAAGRAAAGGLSRRHGPEVPDRAGTRASPRPVAEAECRSRLRCRDRRRGSRGSRDRGVCRIGRACRRWCSTPA